jgi:hypothetical protein
VRAYMVRRNGPTLNPICEGRCQKGAKRRMHVPFWCILVFRKKLFAFWGLSSADLPRMHVPFWGILVFRKKLFTFWGLSSADLPRMHVPFLGILVFRKKLFTFWGLSSADLPRMHVPFWGILVFRKKLFAFLGLSSAQFGRMACPFLGHSFFPIKWIADFRGCRCDKACPFIHCPNQTPTRHRCSHRGHQNFPMMHDTCPLQDLCHSFSAIGRCCAPH